jgi:hypothetical protein
VRKLYFLILLFFLPLVNIATAAESTMNCHCFTDRTFDHQNPGKVTPYLLATTQNSFLAVAFKAQKFKLVKDLMSGVPADQLWISHYFAARFGLDIKAVMAVRQANGRWQKALPEVAGAEKSLPQTIVAALESADDALLAAAVVDEALLSLLQVDADQLKKVRTAGADNRETILSFFLAKRTGQSGMEIYQSVLDKTTNWGTLAFVNNIQIGKMEQEFIALLD